MRAEVELEITNVAHGGISVARHEGRVVFVPDAIPGETVRARITEDAKKSFWRARPCGVVEPSADRQPHVWAAASRRPRPRRPRGRRRVRPHPASTTSAS